MKILHISDWHGDMQLVPSIVKLDYDMVVCSGDLFPNKTRGDRDVEVRYQGNWLRRNQSKFSDLAGLRPIVFCSGNHDFIDPAESLKACGINAVNVDFRKEEVNGLTFYGLPSIPYIAGEWNFESEYSDMNDRIDDFERNCPVDVLVAHAPLMGCLDGIFGQRCGNSVLSNRFFYGDLPWPKMILSGHLHEANGEMEIEHDGVICVASNAACSYRILEL